MYSSLFPSHQNAFFRWFTYYLYFCSVIHNGICLVWWHKHFKKNINVHIIHMWCLFYLAIESSELLCLSESSKKQGVWFSSNTGVMRNLCTTNSSQTWSFSVIFTLQHMHVLIFSTVSIIEVCEEMICSNCWFCIVSQFLLYLRWIANVLCNAYKLYELDPTTVLQYQIYH
jgi:hypothetical protein